MNTQIYSLQDFLCHIDNRPYACPHKIFRIRALATGATSSKEFTAHFRIGNQEETRLIHMRGTTFYNAEKTATDEKLTELARNINVEAKEAA